MQSFKLLTLVLSLSLCGQLKAQKAIDPLPENWTAYQGEVTFNGDSIYLNVTREAALLWLNNINFKNGIVELDLKNGLRGLLGIAFHGLDNENYDAIYFRPSNFRNPEKKDHSVQYIDMPDSPWYTLRKEFPGKYENSVQSVPDPNDWFHAKFEINFPEVKVYVNSDKEPSLVIEQISNRRDGKLGLWVDTGGNYGWFKNVTITKSN